jgi:septum formation topological specificity factor MinE
MPTTSPFRFWTRLTLTKLTGRRAADLAELVEVLRDMPPSVVFYHTHHFLVQHQHLSPEPPNDLAFWVTNVLQEELLGERLAAIDTVQFPSLHELRDKIVTVIDAYLETRHELRTAPTGEEFHFRDAISFVLPTRHQASTLGEFRDELQRVGYATIAYHLFESRLRVGSVDNDFSRWLDHELGEHELATAIRKLDPYTHTMEGLRQRLLAVIDRRLAVGGESR